jgi:adenylate cyclase
MKPSAVRFSFDLGHGAESILVGKSVVVLGRSPTQADVTVREEKISRRHARVVYEEGAWFLEDLGSANGTRLNDSMNPVTREAIRSGDTIMLGEVPIRFDIEGGNQSAAQKVVFSEEASQRNKTAAFRMSDLGLQSEVSDALGTGDNDRAAAWAVSLFTEAAQVILSSTSLDDMLEKILDLVFQNMPAERGVIALTDERGAIEPRVMKRRDGRTDAEQLRISESIAQEAIQSQTAFRVGHALSDEKFGVEESVINMNIQSAMCAPLAAPGTDEARVVGIIYVDFVSRLKPFSEDDLRLLSAFAAFAAVAVEQRRLLDEIRFEQECRAKLSKYNSPQIVERIIANTFQKTGLDGIRELKHGMMAEECEVSILFADLSGFTAMSEFLDAFEVASILNSIFDRLTSCIFEVDGTLDKFMGDAIMAFFGAPIKQRDHAIRAVNAGLMMQETLTEMNAERPEGRNEVRMRIGINTGRVVAGDIGSPDRKDYTVIGDTVNVASRLESTVADPGQVVIGPGTYELVKDHFVCHALEPIPLKGKSQVVQPYLVERLK